MLHQNAFNAFCHSLLNGQSLLTFPSFKPADTILILCQFVGCVHVTLMLLFHSLTLADVHLYN